MKFRESLGYLWAPGVKVKVRRKFEKAWWSTSLCFDKKSLDNNLVFFFSYDENVTGQHRGSRRTVGSDSPAAFCMVR